MNDDLENLGFSHDNPYYAAIRDRWPSERFTPAQAATMMITTLMDPKPARRSINVRDCYAVVNWRDAASLLFKGLCPHDRTVALQRLRARTSSLDKLTILQQLEAIPEFSIACIGSDYKSGSCALPKADQVQSFSNEKGLLAYLPRRAPCVIFDVTSIDTNSAFDIYEDRPQRARIVQRSSAISEMVAEIAELPIECLHDLKGVVPNFEPQNDLPLDLQALQLLIAGLNHYHTRMKQKSISGAD